MGRPQVILSSPHGGRSNGTDVSAAVGLPQPAPKRATGFTRSITTNLFERGHWSRRQGLPLQSSG